MKHFIILTSRVINKLHIIEIIKQPNMYEIHMNKYHLDGYGVLGCGVVEAVNWIITICKNKNIKDYNIITNLLKQPKQTKLNKKIN